MTKEQWNSLKDHDTIVNAEGEEAYVLRTEQFSIGTEKVCVIYKGRLYEADTFRMFDPNLWTKKRTE